MNDNKIELKNCSWKDCEEAGICPHYDSGRDLWASLCWKHELELDSALASLDFGAIVRCWTLAQGGADKARGRLMCTVSDGGRR